MSQLADEEKNAGERGINPFGTSFDPASGAKAVPKTDVPTTRSPLDDWLESLSDFVNPIMVKETRQALKSRQFTLTFFIMLALSLLATSYGIVAQSSYIMYRPSGMPLAMLYYSCLMIPMLIVVPYVAFRSLAGESDDGTFELLSISTLRAREIVIGKLATAVLQMLVYFSAIAPCMAFSYMLRGIDLVTVYVFLSWLFLASFSLTVTCITLATIAKTRHGQTLVSVLIVLGLGLFTFLFSTIMSQITFFGGLPIDQPVFWHTQFFVVVNILAIAWLLIQVAAAEISFATDNRSTGVRLAMFIQSILFAAGVAYATFEAGSGEPGLAYSAMAGIIWGVYGAWLCSEDSELSPRVRRELPTKYWSKRFLTLFQPGPATGYVFATVSLLVGTLYFAVVSMVLIELQILKVNRILTGSLVGTALIVWAYVAFYLAIHRALLSVLNRYFRVGQMPGLLLGGLVAAMAVWVPYSTQALFTRYLETEYTPLQLPNWYWTFQRAVEGNLTLGETIAIICAGAFAFVAHWILNAAVLARPASATPRRVLEDDIAKKPAAKKPRRLSPWDEPSPINPAE